MQPQSEYGPINERRMEVANDDLDLRILSSQIRRKLMPR
jgi:hypothetical protein